MSNNDNNGGCGCLFIIILILIGGYNYISDYLKEKKENEKNKLLYENLIISFDEKKYLNFLTYEHGIYAEKIDSILWTKAVKDRDFKRYVNYNERLNENSSYFLRYFEEAKDSIDINLWKIAKENDNYQMYLEESGKNKFGKYKDIAEKMLESKDSLIWSNEITAWKEAQLEDNSYNYNKFVELFPNSKYTSNAKDLAIKKEIDEIFKDKNTGVLPSFEKNSYSNKSNSTISITNDTGCSLTIWYSGSKVNKYIISEGETHTIKLKSGNYRVAASACGARYAGTEHLSGDYSSTFYIRTVRY